MLAGWRPARLDQYLEPESPALHLGQDRRGNPQLPRPISRTNFRRTTLAEVDELQCQAEIVAFHQGYHGLQVVLLLRGHAELVALDLGADALGPLVPDQLGDLSRVVLGDALLEADGEPELLTGGLRVAGVQRLERHTPPDQLVLEYVQDGLGPVLAVGADLYGLSGPGDRGAHPAEVEPVADLLAGLVQGVVDLLLVDPADYVEE